MTKGDKVLLDGETEVVIAWKGGSLALVKDVNAPENEESRGVALTRLSEKGIPAIVKQDQNDIENLF